MFPMAFMNRCMDRNIIYASYSFHDLHKHNHEDHHETIYFDHGLNGSIIDTSRPGKI